jgi:phosphatidylglycerol---prolipoprotein diacylglyceryl transferase
MIYHTFNPTILKLGFLEIRWYSLFYIIGLTIAYFMILYLSKNKKIKLSKDDVMDFVVYIAIGILIGGRLIYFIFYNPMTLISSPLEFFKLWHGGMSFHGGLIGTVIAGYIFCKIKKINFWLMADLAVVPLGLALALGRIGNFINGELYGRVWNGSLCINYTKNEHLNNLPELCRYPSQLIESAKNLIIFSVIWIIKDKKHPQGFLFWTFVTLYGLFRFFIEFIRQPDPQLGLFLGYLTMGQILCSVMIITGTIMIIKLKIKFRKI